MTLLSAVCLSPLLTPGDARAQNATWLANPGSTNLTSASNWSPASVPTGIATFGSSSATNLFGGSNMAVGTFQFTSQAPSYSFALQTPVTLAFQGAGIANNSANAPSFFLAADSSSSLVFNGTSSAGNANISAGRAASVTFNDSSTGGQARFINNSGFVSFAGVTSGAATAGSIEGSGEFALGANRLTVGANDLSTTVNGVIGGTGGALVKSGAGTLTLSGTNTYTGGTTINGGTLTISRDANLGSTSGGLTFDGGTLATTDRITNSRAVTVSAGGATFNIPDTLLTLNGNISGSGQILKTGSGSLILGGTNSYTGGIVVASGNLGGTASSLLGNIVNNGAVQFVQSPDGTFVGSISGTGSISKVGGGTLTLSGANTYSGGTTIVTGTLQGDTTSLQGDISINGATTLAFVQHTAGTYSGRLSEAGVLRKFGAGTLTLTGTNTHTGGTTISAGTLQVGNGSTSGTLGFGNVTNNGALVFNNNSGLLLFGNLISGSGSLTKLGTDTLALFGANSYRGGTTVNGGVLEGNTTSLQGNIVNNTLVQFNQAGTGTYAGVMSGVGRLAKLNTGTVILSGANTYTGGTAVSGGILQGTTSSLRGNILNDASVVFDQAANGTYAGAMSGTGSLIKQNAGTLILGGTNTHTGGTTVSAGTLQLGVPGPTTASIVGAITNNARLSLANVDASGVSSITTNSGGITTFSVDTGATTRLITNSGGRVNVQASLLTVGSIEGGGVYDLGLFGNLTVGGNGLSTEVNGVISGGGSLVKTGLGTLTLSGTNTYTRGTTVSAGRLVVNGSQAGGVTVGAGGNLGGSGTINGNVGNSGTLSPGNSIGTLTVAGNYTQAAGSTYQVEVNSAGQNDRINITGTATINGGTVGVLAASGTYARSTNYTILNATGGITGTYGAVTSNFAFLTPTLSYDANNVFLNLLQTGNAFSAGAQTGNQRAVGAVLDQASPTATGDFANVLNALWVLNTAQGPAALNAISGQGYSGFGSANVASGLQFMNAIGQQMTFLHGGAGGTGRVALAEACDVGVEGACDGEAAGRWGAWLAGVGGAGSVLGSNGAGTLTYNMGGVAVGLDRRFDPRFLAGVSVGYGTGTQWVNGLDGRATSDSYNFSLYGSFTEDALYLDGVAGYAYNDNRMTRTIAIPGLAPRTAQGRTPANQFLGQIEGGYKVALHAPAAASVTPFARLQGATATQAGFSETGAGSLNLNVAQQTTNSLRSTLGADLAAAFDLGWREKLALRLRLGWLHEYADTARPTSASFAGAPGLGFTVFGAAPQRDSAVLGLAANTAITEATSIYLRYDGEVGQGSDNHVFSAGLRMTW